MLAKYLAHARQFIKMCMVGSIGMFVQLLTYNLFRYVFSPFLSLQLAIILAIIANFYAHSLLTFKDRHVQRYHLISQQGVLFISFSLFNMFLQGLWMNLGIGYFGQTRIIENAMMISGMGWGAMLNYIFYKRFIWTH